jgi:shikimate 5-dehydrogenase/shikimate kinase
MITCIMGHRGVGKTSLLERIEKYCPEAKVFCLDTLIEQELGPISTIFAEKGEDHFRKIELKVFESLVETLDGTNNAIYLAVGGGFPIERIPSFSHKLWVRRDIDMANFYFPNRPSLTPDQKALQVPADKFKQRERRFQEKNDSILTLQEGLFERSAGEQMYFQKNIHNCGGILTLLAEDFEKPKVLEWLKERDEWGLQAFEVRNDLLQQPQIEFLFEKNLRTPLLYSFRRINPTHQQIQTARSFDIIDWDASLGDVPEILKEKSVLSFHTEESDFLATLQKLKEHPGKIKWAPFVTTMEHLELGHKWVCEDPEARSFLPRSQNGRWSWYRRLMKNEMMLQFIREGKGSSDDQPSLLDWITTLETSTHAAVLGAPVKHSWSPTFHADFFRERSMNFFPIHLQAEEASEKTLAFLYRLGFRAFAVTSPLKPWAAGVSHSSENTNTLTWSESQECWLGSSTDMVGFERLLSEEDIRLEEKSVAIWGSGAMASLLKSRYPSAVVWSARTGEAKETVAREWTPQVLVWAAGDGGQEALERLFPHWKPESVVDLNYRTDSPAIAFAHTLGARYVSGVQMFVGQALEQQKIWSQEL